MKKTKMNKEANNLKTRLDTAEYILNISYQLITHYDSKTNQLLALTGFDFTIVSIAISLLFNLNISLSLILKGMILFFGVVDFLLVSVSLWLIRCALIPHVKHVVKGYKEKNGLIYFMDIKNYLGEDEYVELLLGNKPVTESKYYDSNEADAYYNCLIEDCARDIYAHAEILQLKTKYVKWSFNIVVTTSIMSFATVILIALLFALGI